MDIQNNIKSRTYSEDEMKQIFSNIIRNRGGANGSFDYQQLLSTAQELGISEGELRNELNSHNNSYEFQLVQQKILKTKKNNFYKHLTSYLIVNGSLTFFDLWLNSEINFAIYPIIFWGIGLAFDFMGSFFPNKDKILRRANRIIEKRNKYRKKRETIIEIT